MKLRLLLATVLLWSGVARADPQIPCSTEAQALSKASKAVAAHSGMAFVMRHAEAYYFMDFLNNRIGDLTDLRADTLVVALFPDANIAVIGLLNNDCYITGNFVSIDAENFRKAYRSARIQGQPL